jgi:diguanylate cyclase (GGDEF)-like protein/PAS domain S-box-containing protein
MQRVKRKLAAEAERLRALRELFVLDSQPEAVFDRLAQLAASICGVPIALLSLVDEERQWFKANVGLQGVTETPREVAFCAHAIQGEGICEVTDALHDPRFADNPLVVGEPRIRFYAGAPLVIRGDAIVGTLCVIDQQPRILDAFQREMLVGLAEAASHALTMRRDLIEKSLSIRRKYERGLLERATHYRSIVESQSEFISQALPDGTLTYVNPAYASFFGLTPAQMIGGNLFDFVEPSERVAVRQTLDAVLATRRPTLSENRSLCRDDGARWVSWTNTAQLDAGGHIVVHSVGRDVTRRKEVEDALQASQAFLRRTGSVAGVGGWQLDLETGEVQWSEETRRIHGVGSEFKPTLETAINFYAPEARPVIEQAVQRSISSGTGWDVELPLITSQGNRIWVRAVGEAEYVEGAAVRLVGAFQDITQRKALERQVAEQAQTLGLVAESIPATVAIVGLAGTYTFVNSAFEREVGKGRDQILGRTAREILGDSEFERRWPWVERAFNGESVQFELDYASRDGGVSRSISYVPLPGKEGSPEGFVVVSNDITSQKRESRRLLELSQRDSLTGLLNRAGLDDYLRQWTSVVSTGEVAVLYIDLDNFKPVNDQYGHAAGDEVLRCFAERLQSLVRPSDAVARLGGDEFAVALVDLPGHDTAEAIASKVIAAAIMPFGVVGGTILVGASVGIAYGLGAGEHWKDLVDRADEKLIVAKSSGKGRQAR